MPRKDGKKFRRQDGRCSHCFKKEPEIKFRYSHDTVCMSCKDSELASPYNYARSKRHSQLPEVPSDECLKAKCHNTRLPDDCLCIECRTFYSWTRASQNKCILCGTKLNLPQANASRLCFNCRLEDILTNVRRVNRRTLEIIGVME